MAAFALALFAPLTASCSEPSDIASSPAVEADRQPLGLMTSLPIYWGEGGAFGDLLGGEAAAQDDHAHEGTDAGAHWVRTALERDYELVPLDTLAGEDGAVADMLAQIDLLLLAQPYTLTPADNVALDTWLRGGGRLLMFADPRLTEHSQFSLGDRRRPQEIGLVPPVFARWGIGQDFDPNQPEVETTVQAEGLAIPVHRYGRFSDLEGEPETGDTCAIAGGGLVARCRIDEGHAVLVADAAVLEDRASADRSAALDGLILRAFDTQQ